MTMTKITNLVQILNEVEERLLLEIEPEYEKSGSLNKKQLQEDIGKLAVACSEIKDKNMDYKDICKYFRRAVNLLDKYN